MEQTLTAMFDSTANAQAAAEKLVQAGIPRANVQVMGNQGRSYQATSATSYDYNRDEGGFWASLKDLFLPEEDRYAYAEGLSRGGAMVVVRTDSARAAAAEDVLESSGGTVDLDEAEAGWRASGWTGYSASSLAGTGSTLGVSGAGSAASSTASTTATGMTAASGLAAGVAAGRDETIPVYEENIKIGKRDVSRGRVRVRSYVVETPVNEQVQLRSETVEVERRPVDRPVGATDDVFKDRVIEAEAYAEEAVVSKEARVTEEISLRKVAETTTQTVTDSVRRTEVEVEDGRSGLGLAAGSATASGTTAGAFTDRIRNNMDVIAADGQKLGTVDHLDGANGIKLAKHNSPDGQHHYVPLAWVDRVDQHVHLNQNAREVTANW